MKIFLFCKKYLMLHKFQLFTYIIIVIISAAIGIVTPYIIGDFLDTLIAGSSINVVIRFCVIFGGLSIIRILKGYVTSTMMTKMHYQISYELNSDIVDHIQNLSLSYTNQNEGAYLGQRVNGDSSEVVAFSLTILQNLIANTVMLIAPLVILLHINHFITFLLLGFFAVYIALYFVFKEPLYKASLANKESQNKFFAKLFEQLRHIKTVKVHSIQPEMGERMKESFVTMKRDAIHRQKINYVYSGLDGIISTAAQIVLFVMGGIQILAGNFTIGMFTIFSSYFGMMMSSGRYFFGLGASYQQVMVAFNRLSEIFALSKESCGDIEIRDVNKIILKNVNFAYRDMSKIFTLAINPDTSTIPKRDKRILEDFSIEFAKGKMYAVSGANGGGKTTLISLILGLYIDEHGGKIAYDGISIRNINMNFARKHVIAFTEQEPSLIKDSIQYNLIFKNDQIDLDAVGRYVDILGMENFIAQNSLDFVIDEKNSNLSGGEKQKIALLRVLYKNSPVMIFDEPTSALDSSASQRFIGYLQQIKKEKIIILITHDSFVKAMCDEEIAIEQKQAEMLIGAN